MRTFCCGVGQGVAGLSGVFWLGFKFVAGLVAGWLVLVMLCFGVMALTSKVKK